MGFVTFFFAVSNTTCIKSAELKTATCFSYNEPSSGHKQNKVLVHSMIVHCMGYHIVYSFNGKSYIDILADLLKKNKI
jgi:hypothetical protein